MIGDVKRGKPIDGLVCNDQYFEQYALVDWELVKLHEDGGDVIMFLCE